MECVFCNIVRRKVPADIVFENSQFLAFLDIHPQSRGHIQLIPKKHYTWVYDLPEMGKLFATAGTIIHAIIPALGADHVTLSTYGHEVQHAHIWIVPQYAYVKRLSEGSHTEKGFNDRKALAQLLRNAVTKEVSI